MAHYGQPSRTGSPQARFWAARLIQSHRKQPRMCRHMCPGTMVRLSSTGDSWLHNSRLEPARSLPCVMM